MSRFYKDRKPANADEAITKASEDKEVTTVTDEDVAKERQEAGEDIGRTMNSVADNTETDIDSKNSGVKGAKVSSMFKKVTGAPKAMNSTAAAPMARGWTDFGTPHQYTAADSDHLERNAQMAAIAFENVHANIIREATQGTDNGDTTIIGTPDDNNVYSEETTITVDTLTSKGVFMPVEHPRKREVNTMLARKPSMVSISGDYIHAVQSDLSNPATITPGHDSDKNWHDYETLLLNRLDANGALMFTNTENGRIPHFVAPKRGRYWLRGFSMDPGKASPLVQVGTVARNYRGTTVECPVYQANDDGLFDVLDVTPTADKMQQAAAETARLLTCNKSKFTMGQAEQVAQIFAKAQEVIDVPTEIITWPEYARTGRSTLSFCNQGSDSIASCYNDLEVFAEFMHYLQESEVVYAAHRINNEPIKSNLKFFRNMEGQNAQYPYWRSIFQGDPETLQQHDPVPTIANYAATKASTRNFNTMGKWIYTFRAFWSDLEAYCGAFDEGVLDERILSTIKIGKDAADQIISDLKLGKLIDDESVNSASIALAPNTVDIVLAFDPNDLVDYTYADAENHSGQLTAWAAAGYENIYTRTSALDSEFVVYNIIPTWMQVWIRAVSSPAFSARILDTRMGRQDGTIREWFRAGGYAPLIIDTLRPSWLSLVFAEATLLFKERVFSPRNQVSGFLRYLKALNDFNAAGVYEDDVVPIHYLIDQVCGGEGFFFDENMDNPTNYPTLPLDIARDRLDEDIYRVSGFGRDFALKGAELNVLSMLALQPDKLHSWVRNFDGWQYRFSNADTWNNFPAADADNEDARATLDAFINSGIFDIVTTPDGRDGLVVKHGDHNVAVLIRRRLSDKSTITVEVPQFGADTEVLGFENNPESYMYGKDSHINLPACHAFVLTVHYGSLCAIDDDANTNVVTSNIQLIPVILGQNDSDKSFKSPVQAVTYLKPLSQKANAHNRITKSGADPIVGNLNTLFALSCIPSLYGYKRVCLASFHGISYNYAADDYACRLVAPYNASVLTSGAHKLSPVATIGWRPRTIAASLGVAIGRDTPNNVAELIRMTDRDVQVGDWCWYAATTMVADSDAGLPADNVATYESAADLYAAGGYIVDPLLITGHSTANSDTIVENKSGALSCQSQGRDYTIPGVAAWSDYAGMYFSKFWRTPSLIEAYFALNTSVNEAEYCFQGENDNMRNFNTLSRFYRNDIRSYIIDRPVMRLNRNWYTYGFTTPLFAKRFVK